VKAFITTRTAESRGVGIRPGPVPTVASIAGAFARKANDTYPLNLPSVQIVLPNTREGVLIRRIAWALPTVPHDVTGPALGKVWQTVASVGVVPLVGPAIDSGPFADLRETQPDALWTWKATGPAGAVDFDAPDPRSRLSGLYVEPGVAYRVVMSIPFVFYAELGAATAAAICHPYLNVQYDRVPVSGLP
jgi:hypothetical protein